LRAGAVVERDEKPTGDDGCKHGWYAVKPLGFICVGDLATIDLDDPIVKDAKKRPDLTRALPYAYGIAKGSIAPFYARVPTTEEARRLEADFDAHQKDARKHALFDAAVEYDAGVFVDEIPDFLRDGGVVPDVSNLVKSRHALWAGRPRYKEGFAIVASFVAGPGGTPPSGGPDDRRFDLTTDYLLLPHDRLREVKPSAFHGIALDENTPLPVAFVRPRYHPARLKSDGSPWATTASDATAIYEPRAAIPITGETRSFAGASYLVTRDGGLVKADSVIKIDAPKNLPAFAAKGEKWIEVSITRQSITAFEGDRGVYVSLVSTGIDGLGDPESSHATIRGVYRIHQKHATITMDSTVVGEEFSLRDVPYVQYFEGSYALHAAYWHDGFGEPRSHGCINLAPIDAQWLFGWTGPTLPEKWHGVLARPLSSGTPIWIHA
jgi:lipoprotein-anchoring transpeptidase ErfK/SrfK